MKKWARARFMPNKPLYEDRGHVTASKEHITFSRKAAAEGMVLLKNADQLLPFASGDRVAVFGKGLFDYVKGGGGSGDVSTAYVRNLYDGLRMSEETIELYEPLVSFYKEYVEGQYQQGALPGLMREPGLSEEMVKGAASFADTALIVLCRFSGEAWDRESVSYEGQADYEAEWYKKSGAVFGKSDYYLTKEEERLLAQVKNNFEKIAVILNVGGIVDTSWFVDDSSIRSVLWAWQGGIEGGAAMADILMGRVNPSGKLPDTLAADLYDYPGARTFHESPVYVDYSEGIYVGYRYFETMEDAKKRVNYPFGFGLSYTTFTIETLMACEKADKIYFSLLVKNTGSLPGKEVVQLYVKAPEGKLSKAARSLVAFEKTRLLKPGEEQMVSLCVPFYAMASYDEEGQIVKSAYVLEKGLYHFYVGNSVRNAERISFSMELKEDRLIQQLSAKCIKTGKPYKDDNILDPLEEPIEGAMPGIRGRGRAFPEQGLFYKTLLIDVAEGRAAMEDLLFEMTDQELCDLLGGQPNMGIANTFGFGNNERFGIPSLMTTDGPAGVRILPEHEIYTTALPCSSALASTWNRDLLYDIGVVAAEEVKENNLYIWLAPAVNIHRNPLCGRNFEYYSEDPLLAGTLAASLIRGAQSMGTGTAVKHFACNNKETNRKDSDSRLTERALREIYLKQFEIIVREASPWVVMSSYNLINGVRASENKELLTDILRGEWGFTGVVCSDWHNHGEHYKELLAGNDIKMGVGYPDRLMAALEKGAISRQDLLRSAERILRMIIKAD